MKDEKKSTRERLSKFLRDEVFKDKTLDDLSSLAGYIAANGNDFIVSFCDWLELGEWFIEELDDCEFNVDEFLSDLRHDWEEEAKEASKEQYESMLEYQRVQGW